MAQPVIIKNDFGERQSNENVTDSIDKKTSTLLLLSALLVFVSYQIL